MEQYIPKDALVAWALEELKLAEKFYKETESDVYFGKINLLKKQLSFLGTIEVKEVDLEKEIDKFYGMYRKDGQTFSLEDNEECVDWKVDCNPEFEKSFAKHFFELGLKTQHSSINIPNIDDIFEENGIDPNSKDAKICKESYYMALEKLKEQKGERV